LWVEVSATQPLSACQRLGPPVDAAVVIGGAEGPDRHVDVDAREI
jgi:hypothetical protein